MYRNAAIFPTHLRFPLTECAIQIHVLQAILLIYLLVCVGHDCSKLRLGPCLSNVILAEGVGEDTEVEADVGLDSKAETECDKAG